MTDLTPNDLSHLSDEEFNALCPQGEHAPGREPLSLAAQAVLDAFKEQVELTWLTKDPEQVGLAAALRAAADQVVPEWKTTPGGSKVWQSEPVPSIRAELLAIAAELEGAND